MRTRLKSIVLLSFLFVLGVAAPVTAQLLEPGKEPATPHPLVDSSMTKGKQLLFDLEARFAKAISGRGGKVFQDWFAPHGVLLGSGAVPFAGLVAIGKIPVLVARGLPTHLDTNERHDGPLQRYRVSMRPLRVPQQRRQRKS